MSDLGLLAIAVISSAWVLLAYWLGYRHGRKTGQSVLRNVVITTGTSSRTR